MESALNPYVPVDSLPFVPDIWDIDGDQPDIHLDILLPNGYFLEVTIHKEATLLELKDEVWELAQNCPLFSLLRDSEYYVFQCVNLTTADRDNLVEENRRLCDVRPFQGVLRVVEKQGDTQDEILKSRLGFVIGVGMRELDSLKDPEVRDFRKQIRLFCESVCQVLSPDTFEQRVLWQHPVSLESNPELPSYLREKLIDDGKLVLAISVDRQETERAAIYGTKIDIKSTCKLQVSPSLNAQELFELVLTKKGPSLGLQSNQVQNHLLKICGLEEFLIGPHPLSQYKYIRECLSLDKTPELILFPMEKIHLEQSIYDLVKGLERQRSCSITGSDFSSKRKKTPSVSSWSISEAFTITIHSVHKLNHDTKTKVSVQCSIYHADERLCKVLHTSERVLQEGHCDWEEVITFDLEVYNLPRMAKVCLAIFEISPSQKNSKFRKSQDKYVCPIAWVNTTVFDYRGHMKSLQMNLSTWPSTQEGDDYSSCMLRPLGWLISNPRKDLTGVITISFGKFHPSLQVIYPTIEEILEFANKESNDKKGTDSPTNEPQASKSYLQQLQQICEKDTLYQLHEQEKELMWFLRKQCCEQLPNSLPKLLRCLKWNDRNEIAQMTKLVQLWTVMTPYKTLELLDYAYPDPMVRSFAVKCLRNIGNEELLLYLLQLVQALKHEPYIDNSLVKLLLERALENRHIGHRLFWLLRSEIQFPEVSTRFALILEAYCRSVPSHLTALEKQVDALEKLKKANNQIQCKSNLKKDCKEKMKSHIQDTFGKNVFQAIFHNLLNPLDPRFKFGKIRVEKCKCLDSKMKPLWLVFENTDTYGKDVFLIFKNGDDLRQDMLTLQMIRIMDRLWKDEGLDLRMIPYQCMAMGPKMGLIEVVPNSDTIANIQKEKGFTATSAFKKGSILSWLKDHNPDDTSLSRAAEEFTLSCAGYCVATYVLGVADRHSDNIMVKTNGQLFHVDFGHILGKFKEKFGFKRERVPFVLTHDFVYIITKGQTQRSQEFTRFQQYCERAFKILRKRGPLMISLFAMMLSTGIPELSSERDLEYLRDTLVLDLSEQEALKHFRSKFDEALKNSWKTSVNWMAHNWAKDNKMSD